MFVLLCNVMYTVCTYIIDSDILTIYCRGDGNIMLAYAYIANKVEKNVLCDSHYYEII